MFFVDNPKRMDIFQYRKEQNRRRTWLNQTLKK